MADVRKLLRNERTSRRIDHPNASYSTTGTLECTVCHIPLKSDVDVWNQHLRSTQHAMRAERLRLHQRSLPSREDHSTSTQALNGANKKKRKASDEDDDSRKRARPVVSFSEPIETDTAQPSDLHRDQPQPPVQPVIHTPHIQPSEQTINEDEWAAFERDVATPPPGSLSAPSAISVQAVISAAPVSAAELAAQQKEEERATGKERKEAEIEAEKEDATRALEEEFEEMEVLEERVRRLREKREELRRRRASEGGGESGNGGGVSKEVEMGAAEERVSEDSSEDEDFDEWGFGR